MKNKKNELIPNNTVKIEGIDELRKIQLELLDEVALFCDQNNIKYFLAYGTLLGAVRHQGYIPWDDDIDLLMKRKDYDKFTKLYKNNDKYYKLNCENDKDYWISFMKFCKRDTFCQELDVIPIKGLGVNIDIFPLDYLPENNFLMNKQYYEMKLSRIIYSIKKHSITKSSSLKNNMFFLVTKALCIFFPLRFVNYRINKIARRYNKKKTSRVECLITINQAGKQIFDASIFSDTKKILFEGKEYSAPIKTVAFLEKNFGDYMKLPPLKEQVTHHTFDAYKIKK